MKFHNIERICLLLGHKAPESILASRILLALARAVMTSLSIDEEGYLFMKGIALLCGLGIGDKSP